ncbi:acetyltransferase, GNAT family [Pseudonocardia sp. Ae406_Ps2]|nr:acetyltransferase, GNAT family [Pseudonocardia sp. Ae331_Ps2]OLM02888.1 acetyltransferase, GNAT family [Pseudonocardia sp. Ae406_Ps2]OLM24466.1 acetyltransferase, GNAT family [Pseudonocardia sp. Ae706_Ps2]
MRTSTSPTTLRPANAADREAIAELWHDGWRDGHVGHVPDALLGHRTPATFRHRTPAQISSTTVVVDHDDVIGFVTVKKAEIEQLYVGRAARGTGAAAQLLRHGEGLISADGHPRCWLAVAPGNRRARRFYEREGWRDVGAIDYEARTAGEATIVVPCRRYEKNLPPAGGRA